MKGTEKSHSNTLIIEPVTRIEGHARITLYMDENGEVENALFHVTQFRGFEAFCVGRPFYELPGILSRTCGICPVSHLIAGAKACDDLLAVEIPPVANRLRKIMHLAQILQSHALSYFFLSAPDLVFGMDGDAAKRNVCGLAEKMPELAKRGILLRKTGQSIIELLGGRRIHPTWVVPGGVASPLSQDAKDAILAMLPPAKEAVLQTIGWHKGIVENFYREIQAMANFPSLYAGLVNRKGYARHYDGRIRFMDSNGNVIQDHVEPHEYARFIEEAERPWTYMKFPFYRPLGEDGGMYRVGPLARLNIADGLGTPLADEELKAFKALSSEPIRASFHYHWARLIEMLYAIEKIEMLLNDAEILSRHVRSVAAPNRFEGIGVVEAPRGLLVHHYRIDENGLVTGLNLIVATGHNNFAMNRGILQAARVFVRGERIQEGMLNAVEAVIRCFDPCLSCATHAFGRPRLHIDLVSPDGRVVDSLRS